MLGTVYYLDPIAGETDLAAHLRRTADAVEAIDAEIEAAGNPDLVAGASHVMIEWCDEGNGWSALLVVE